MTGIILALLSSASFAASHVISRRGVRGTSLNAGFVVIVGSALVVVSIPLLLDPPNSVSTRAAVIFAISGLFAPALSRAAALAGVRALGPSISVPIQQGLRPLIVVPAAVLLLGETFGLTRVLGLAAIVAGGWVLSRDRETAAVVPGEGLADDLAPSAGEPTSGGTATTIAERRARPRLGFRRGIVFPIAAAIGYSASDLLVKIGLGDATDPVYAAPLSIGTGLAVWGLAHAFPQVRRRFRLGPHAGWLVVSGVFMGTAILLLFHALSRGDVSLVTPVIGTQPLFVVLLSAIVLRGLERRERATLVAASIVVLGTVLVAL